MDVTTQACRPVRRAGFWSAGILTAAFLAWMGILQAEAISQRSWAPGGIPAYLDGTLEGVEIAENGVIRLSRKEETFTRIEEPYIWSLAWGEKGQVYAGTGHDGKVYRLDAKGKAEMVMDSPEYEILSLASDGKGGVFAGTAPEGIIYHIPSSGEPATYYLTGEDEVWSLVYEKGVLYAGTGTGGKIFAVTKKGEGEVYYATGQAHVVSLAWNENALYAGTYNTGLIYRIEAKEKARVLYDSTEMEIHALAFAPDGRLYFAGISGKASKSEPPPAPPGPGPKVSRQNKEKANGKTPEKRSAKGKSETPSFIGTVDPDGTVRRIWEAPDAPLTAMGFAAGKLIAAGGEDGVLWEIDPKTLDAVLVRGPVDSKVVGFLSDKDGNYLVNTGGQSKLLVRINAQRPEGSLVSDIIDAQQVVHWGRLRWIDESKGGSLKFSVRQGNSPKPDVTWTGWSDRNATASGLDVGEPSTRYLQWKVILRGSAKDSPAFRDPKVFSITSNRQPRVTAIKVYPQARGIYETGGNPPEKALTQKLPGGVTVKYFTGGESGQTKGQWLALRGMRTLSWRASDPDGDKMVYDVFLRKTGEEPWRLVTEDAEDGFTSFDTSALSEGHYVIKVTAYDDPSNPYGEGLEHSLESDPFLVDNTPPAIEGLTVTWDQKVGLKVKASATDTTSAIGKAELSVDGSEFVDILPVDHIFDALTESFDVIVKPDDASEKVNLHTVILHVYDEDGNMGLVEAAAK